MLSLPFAGPVVALLAVVLIGGLFFRLARGLIHVVILLVLAAVIFSVLSPDMRQIVSHGLHMLHAALAHVFDAIAKNQRF